MAGGGGVEDDGEGVADLLMAIFKLLAFKRIPLEAFTKGEGFLAGDGAVGHTPFAAVSITFFRSPGLVNSNGEIAAVDSVGAGVFLSPCDNPHFYGRIVFEEATDEIVVRLVFTVAIPAAVYACGVRGA